MIINTYKVCQALAKVLKSKIMASIEANELQKYSDLNFDKKTIIYNQIAIDKSKYDAPSVAIQTIGQNDQHQDVVGIDIDFKIPVDEILEVVNDGVVEYKDREKLDKFADILVKQIGRAHV